VLSAAYFEGLVTPEERDELARLLEKDSEWRARFMKLYELEQLLGLEFSPVSREAFQNGILQSIQVDRVSFSHSIIEAARELVTSAPGKLEGRLRRIFWPVFLTASVVVAAFFHTRESTRPTDRLELSTTSLLPQGSGVELRRGTNRFYITQPMALKPGDRVVVGQQCKATFTDKLYQALVTLEPGADLEIGPAPRLRLHHGRIFSRLEEQINGKPFRIDTLQGVAEARASRFTLEAGENFTRLEVIEGLVELASRDGKAAAKVGSGHFAVMGERGLSPARPIPEITVDFGPPNSKLPDHVLVDSGEEFDPLRGYGWIGPKDSGHLPGVSFQRPAQPGPVPIGRTVGPSQGNMADFDVPDPLYLSFISVGWKNHSQTWKMRLADGRYRVTVCMGDYFTTQGPHRVVLQGQVIIDGEVTTRGNFLEIKEIPVSVTDGELIMEVGGYSGDEVMPDGSSDNILNFIVIKAEP